MNESERQQRLANTWDRNCEMWKRFLGGDPQVLIASDEGISKQCVGQIIQRFVRQYSELTNTQYLKRQWLNRGNHHPTLLQRIKTKFREMFL